MEILVFRSITSKIAIFKLYLQFNSIRINIIKFRQSEKAYYENLCAVIIVWETQNLKHIKSFQYSNKLIKKRIYQSNMIKVLEQKQNNKISLERYE